MVAVLNSKHYLILEYMSQNWEDKNHLKVINFYIDKYLHPLFCDLIKLFTVVLSAISVGCFR